MPASRSPRPKLSQQDRHAQILALLRREGTVRIATLADLFAVTTETARRDLDDLAEVGALNRTYGGGASHSLTEEPGIGERGRAHAAERARIVAWLHREAQENVPPDMGIVIRALAREIERGAHE